MCANTEQILEQQVLWKVFFLQRLLDSISRPLGHEPNMLTTRPPPRPRQSRITNGHLGRLEMLPGSSLRSTACFDPLELRLEELGFFSMGKALEDDRAWFWLSLSWDSAIPISCRRSRSSFCIEAPLSGRNSNLENKILKSIQILAS